MKVSKYFDIVELVPEIIYEKYGDNSIWFLDPKLLDLLDFIREDIGNPLIINTWHKGGNQQNRGFRSPMAIEGARLSQHKFGRAADFTVEGIEAKLVRQRIKDYSTTYMEAGLTAIEDFEGMDWIHVDIRNNQGSTTLLIFGK